VEDKYEKTVTKLGIEGMANTERKGKNTVIKICTNKCEI
jgi:hypothetical protein